MNMKPENDAITPANSNPMKGSEHALWIGGGGESLLTFTLNKNTRAFPPRIDQCAYLNQMIKGLARAVKDVMYRAENDVTANSDFVMQPIADIADAIIMLSQLSEAVQAEAQS
jgi:hypothetical protein